MRGSVSIGALRFDVRDWAEAGGRQVEVAVVVRRDAAESKVPRMEWRAGISWQGLARRDCGGGDADIPPVVRRGVAIWGCVRSRY